MIVLPETGTETTIPADYTVDKMSAIYSVHWRDLSFNLVPVSRLEIKKRFANESRRRSVVSSRQQHVSARF